MNRVINILWDIILYIIVYITLGLMEIYEFFNKGFKQRIHDENITELKDKMGDDFYKLDE